jgi:CHAT domain-containing protein
MRQVGTRRYIGAWVCIAALLAVSASATAAKPKRTAPSQASADLHNRIQAAYNAAPPSDAKAELAALEPLMRDALAAGRVDADDFANLSLIYALALYHNERVQEASDTIARALRVYERAGLGDTAQLSDLLKNQAIYLNALGQPDAAIRMQQRALEVISRRDGGDGQQAGSIMASMAFAYGKTGRLQEALKTYDRAMVRMTAENGMAGAYSGHLGNYAGQLSYAGDYDQALQMSQKSLEVAVANLPESNRAVRWAYSRLGDQLTDLGRNSEAEVYSRRAYDLAVTHTGKISGESGAFGYNLSRVLHRMGRTEEAEAMALNALDVIRQKPLLNNPDTQALILMELADLAFERGDAAGAAARLQEGLAALETLGARGLVTRSTIQTRLSRALFVQGRLQEALIIVRTALPYYRKEYPEYAKARLDAEMLEALILSRQGHAQEAYAMARPVADVMRARLFSIQLTVRERAELAEVYRNNFARFVDIALAAEDADAAFEAAQLVSFSESAVNVHMLARRASLPDPRAQTLFADLEALQTEIFRLERERAFALGKSEAVVAETQGALDSARRELEPLNAALAAEVASFRDLMQPTPQSLPAARTRMAARQALLMPVSVDDQLITLVLTAKGLSYDRSPTNQTAVKIAVARLLVSLGGDDEGRAFDEEAARELGQAIFTRNNLRALDDVNEISVLGAGPIMRLPMSILIVKPGGLRPAYAVNRFAFSVTHALLQRPRSETPVMGFAGIGAPVLGPEASAFSLPDSQSLHRGGKVETDLVRRLPSLPMARVELERLLAAFGNTESLLLMGADATETRVKRTPLARFEAIAFATHGLMGGDVNALTEPALVLTPPETATDEDDGLLMASEVAGLKLNARWVILSACNSGAEREAGAPVYSGLAQAFMQAGAQNLLVSLWPVRDDVADQLSVETVRLHRQGLSRPQALRQAMLRLRKNRRIGDASHPSVWAPFSLVMQ